MPDRTLATYFDRVFDMAKYFDDANNDNNYSALAAVATSTPGPFAVVSPGGVAENLAGKEQLLSDADRDLLELVVSFVTLFVSLLGVATNSINLRVFLKQGVTSDSTTIGFFALAIADFLACFISLPQSVCFVYKILELPADYANCHAATLMTSQYPRHVFSRISCWVNVYIAIERCLCVLLPLKIKLLIRPRLTGSIMIAIFVFFGFFHLPLGVNTWIEWEFNEKFNRSVLTLKETAVGQRALYYQSLIGTTILSSAAVVIVTLSTGLLIYKLNLSRNWSKSVSSAGATGTGSASASGADKTKMKSRKRDLEAMKTVSAVTGLFLACLSMSHIPALASLAIPGFSINGENSNLLYALFNLKFLFDTINSAVNFFFYINISSRYKAAFNAVFRCGDKSEGNK